MDFGQDFLRQDGQADRADMAAGFGALDHQGVGAGADQAFGQHQRGGEGDELGAAVLHRAHGVAGRDAAGQHDVADLGAQADLHQVVELRVHGDEVDAERLGGQRLGAGDLGFEQGGGHGAARDDAEAAGVGDGGDQVALADPAHGAAHDGGFGAEEGRAARPQRVEAGAGRGRLRGQAGGGDVRWHQDRRRCAGRGPRVRCIRRRSAR